MTVVAPAAATSPWTDAVLAAALAAIDPRGCGGVALRAGAGPVRDRWLALLRAYLPSAAPVRRVPAHVPDDRLLGGLDLVATLRAGRPVAQRGLLAEADGGLVIVAGAERIGALVAARLAGACDTGEVTVERDGIALRTPARFVLAALDEGAAEEERPPAALLERLAFLVSLEATMLADTAERRPAPADIDRARERLPRVRIDDEFVAALCGAALALGVRSLRAPLYATRAARAAAALAGREAVTADDAAAAARLVLAARATTLPAGEDEASTPDEPPPQRAPDDRDGEQNSPTNREPAQLEDVVLAAAAAALPPGLLAQLQVAAAVRSRAAAGGRSKAERQGTARGRPAGVRRGEPGRGARINVVETLRVAAPWQPLRRRARAAGKAGPRIEVRRDDLRVNRYKRRTRTTTIFVVDASGSAALHRLGEAKGAVELLLAECYVRRDRVALVAFRGQGAELVLPPTRSLARAKRCLAGLPGGGGTPLASGIEAAVALADGVRRAGDAPLLVFLTDGRANVTTEGKPDRATAETQAIAMSRRVRGESLRAIVVDTSPRPQPLAERIAGEMGARYLPLPHARSTALDAAVRSASDA